MVKTAKLKKPSNPNQMHLLKRLFSAKMLFEPVFFSGIAFTGHSYLYTWSSY